MEKLLSEIRSCKVCEVFLSNGTNPVLSAHPKSKIVIIGQAPGSKVHESGIPWDDASGKRLREWMGVSSQEFYNEELIALVPMGFCYPGRGRSGDLAPRPECAPLWHQKLLDKMPNVELTLLVGSYAMNYYLTDKKRTLTDTVRSYTEYLPKFIPLPHPSPRNNIWLKRNEWFEAEVLPNLQSSISSILH